MKQLITLLLALITLTGQAKNERSNERVWNDVVTGYNNTYNQVNVTKVAFYEDRTELSLHVDIMAGQWISINEKTFLQADGKQYAVKDVTVLKLGEQYTLPTDTLDFKVIFEPVPLDIQYLDMIEPGGWYFPNIRSASMLPKDITNTYWRDETTGDWLIGIGQNHVIYNTIRLVWHRCPLKFRQNLITSSRISSSMACPWACEDCSLRASLLLA